VRRGLYFLPSDRIHPPPAERRQVMPAIGMWRVVTIMQAIFWFTTPVINLRDGDLSGGLSNHFYNFPTYLRFQYFAFAHKFTQLLALFRIFRVTTSDD
jgi:hypothetical protein